MRIAIVRLSALGDIVNSLFILEAIKTTYPNAHIEWICEQAFTPLLERHPAIDVVHGVAIKQAKQERSFRTLRHTIMLLRALGTFDTIIDLQGLIKSAIVSRLIGPNVHGFDRDSLREGGAAWFYKTTSHIPYRENAILRTAHIISDALHITIDKKTLLNKAPALPLEALTPHLQAFFSPNDPNIILTLGSSWPSKIYPQAQFNALITLLEGNIILVWGNEAEKAVAEALHQNHPHTQIAPKLSIDALMQLIGHGDLIIGNDSGPTHMAWAMNRPSITLFGPTPAYKMMFETPINIAIESPSTVNPLKLNRDDHSIGAILPEQIAVVAHRLLQSTLAH